MGRCLCEFSPEVCPGLLKRRPEVIFCDDSLGCGHTETSEITPTRYYTPSGIQDTANLSVALSTPRVFWPMSAPKVVLEYCPRRLSPTCSGVSLLSSQLLQEEQKGSA